jgi:WD40 repeat protein
MITFTAVAQYVNTGVAFAPDGLRLATASHSYSMLLWNLTATPTVIRQWPGTWGTTLSFSPDGRFLARGWTVRVWEVEGPNKPVLEPSGLASEAVAFSPTGQEFAIVNHEGLQRWAVPSWRPLPGGWGGTGEFCGGLTYSPDGSLLAVGVARSKTDRTESVLRLWDTATGRLRHTLALPFAIEESSVLRFSPDGRLLAAICGPILSIWDVANETEIASHKTGRKHLKGLAFTRDSQRLATVSNDTTVRQWAAPEWAETTGFTWKKGKMVSIDASADGCRMAAGTATGKVIVWDLD